MEAALHALINQPLEPGTEERLYDWREYSGASAPILPSWASGCPPPRTACSTPCCGPQRLLELIYQFIVYDDGVKKIARYQQYFAIQATIDRVAHRNAQGTRTGGVIWHTTGSGKSLTMVMLAKALALHPAISNPRVVLVTDRVNLDDQICGTFQACGKSVVQAESGRHLVRLVTGELGDGERQADIITTVINKFDQAAAPADQGCGHQHLRAGGREPPQPVRHHARQDAARLSQRLLHRLHRHAAHQAGEVHRREVRQLHPQVPHAPGRGGSSRGAAALRRAHRRAGCGQAPARTLVRAHHGAT